MSSPLPVHVPLGVRLHNPLCMRASPVRYQGEVPSPHPAFKAFCDNPHGFRAGIEDLCAYQTNDGIKTIAEAIERWAPPEDGNPTGEYAANVARQCGVEVDTPILFSSYWHQILRAMSDQECGPGYFTDAEISLGIELAGNE